MRSHILFSSTFLAASAVAQNTATGTSAVAAAAATALTRSPVSNVAGKAFDRLAIIWLENTDYDDGLNDPNLSALAKKGITLSNYYGVTHPSEPNYVASIGGDYFGMDNDNFHHVPANVSTVIDLLEDKGVSWGHYEEDSPYSGFEGIAYVNQKTRKNDYVRKHDPAVIYDSVANDKNRLAQIKNFTLFQDDLDNETLPQWMFITPNMTNDGHDTSVTVAGQWTSDFLTPLLSNPKFTKNTLILLTFDECETYTNQNRMFALLLGDAIPTSLQGTTDSSFYDHYSAISTVEANWDLHTLGRWDVGANVFSFVGQKTNDSIRTWTTPAFDGVFLNTSYPGDFNSQDTAPIPVPNTAETFNGRSVLPAIAKTWASAGGQSYYDSRLEIPDGMHPPQ